MTPIRTTLHAKLPTASAPIDEPDTYDRPTIAALNDQLRRDPKNAPNGRIVFSAGVIALLEGDGQSRLDEYLRLGRLKKLLHEYSEFGFKNDPYGEHDCGGFEFEGQNLLFKIDYYDLSMEQHSPDPADPDVTVRVLTVMTRDEY